MYEIKTPDMIRVRDVSNKVIDGILGGTMDLKVANTVNNAAGTIVRAFKQDLQARLALADLIETEAKIIEAQKATAPELPQSAAA